VSVLHIAMREARAIFTTPVGWLVLCGWLLVTGIFWVASVGMYVAESQNVVFNPYGAALLNLQDHLVMPFYGNTTVVLVFVVPAVSMRLFSEEFKQRTMELLLTSPVSTLEIVLGKYLGALAFVLVALACTLHFPLTLEYWGEPDLGAIAGGYLALFSMSAALLAVGLLASSFTSNQIVALVVAFAASLALYVGGWLADGPDHWIARLGLLSHLEDMLRGAVRLSDLVYFAGIVGVSLFATWQRLESFRWR